MPEITDLLPSHCGCGRAYWPEATGDTCEVCQTTDTATDDCELDRLTDALHAVQRHPDYDYSVTYVGNTAHTSRDGWERNPPADQDGFATYPAMLGWRRRKV